MFDNTRPVAANAQRVSWHMFEMIPNVADVIMFAAPPQGDGVSCETAQLGEGEVVEKNHHLASQQVSISIYL